MKLTLVKKVNEAKGTRSFFWKPEKKVLWLPGQYYYYTLPSLKYPNHRGNTRHFTISSSPTEDNLLRLTTRIREESGFKKSLDELPIGSKIEGDGPSGTFILDNAEKDNTHVFLAGGIGITPFRAFIKHNIDKNLKTPMHLIYSNSDNDFTFGSELKKWDKQNDFINIEFVDTSKFGHINEAVLTKLFGIWNLKFDYSTLWVVGPPPFVDAMEEVLEKIKIPSDHIRSEKFTGY